MAHTTVRELVAQLLKEDQDRIVVMQRYPSSAEYTPFRSFWKGAWRRRAKPGFLRVGLERLTAKLRGEGFTRDDVAVRGIPALILVSEE